MDLDILLLSVSPQRNLTLSSTYLVLSCSLQGILVSRLVSCPALLAWGYQSPFPDAFPDPLGRHTLSTRILVNVPYNVCCWGCVKLWHKIPIIRYKVPPDFVEVLHRGRQVQLHTSEYVQQRLCIVKEDEKHRLVKTLDWSGNYIKFFEAWTSPFTVPEVIILIPCLATVNCSLDCH